MRRHVMTAIAAGLALAAAVGPVSADECRTREVPLLDAAPCEKLALVIGIDRYDCTSKLPYGDSDAQAFAQMLRRHGFTDDSITLVTDSTDCDSSRQPTYIGLRRAIKSFVGAIGSRSEVVVFFAGLGARTGGTDYWVPRDGDPNDIRRTCIDYDEVRDEIAAACPHRSLVITDGFANCQEGKSRSETEYGESSGDCRAAAELRSCFGSEFSHDSTCFGQSVFTHYLLRALAGDSDAANDEGVVTADSLSCYLRTNVERYVADRFHERQHPVCHVSMPDMEIAGFERRCD